MKAQDRQRRRREMVQAGEVIEDLISGYHLTDEIRQIRLYFDWPALVGPEIARRSRPGALQDRILRVHVRDSVWLHELSFLRSKLVHTLNDALGEPPLIDDLRLVLGYRNRLADAPPEVQKSARRTRKKALPTPASGLELKQILDETEAIGDPELREIVAKVRARHNR